MEIKDVCALCGSKDNDKRNDHLRECYKLAQDKLDYHQYKPHLFQTEMDTLQRGSNVICSNMRLCRTRRKQETKGLALDATKL